MLCAGTVGMVLEKWTLNHSSLYAMQGEEGSQLSMSISGRGLASGK